MVAITLPESMIATMQHIDSQPCFHTCVIFIHTSRERGLVQTVLTSLASLATGQALPIGES
eukprot:COSAG01_NODE_631_length_14683_cov_4.558077_4_plen_61_part_00